MTTKYQKTLNKNPSWTKKVPGRRHNHLTAREQQAKDQLMQLANMNATQALKALGKV